MSKRPHAAAAADTSNSLYLRGDKLEKNGDGTLVSQQQGGIEKEQDNMYGAVVNAFSGVADQLETEKGPKVWESAIGTVLKRICRHVSDNPATFPIEDDDDKSSSDQADDEKSNSDQVLTPARMLSSDDLAALLTKGFAESIQDPMWSRSANDPGPILQISGAVKEGEAQARDRPVSTVTLTAVDGDGYMMTCRVATTMTEEAKGIGRGYAIQLREFHRLYISEHNPEESEAGIALMHFDVVGKGPESMEGHYRAYPQRLVSQLQDAVVELNGSEPAEEDPLQGWDEQYERPPVPEKCTAPNRKCSMYGVHYFTTCICEVSPVKDRNLKAIAAKYSGVTEDLGGMSATHIRNMLFWSYATDIYSICGYKNRRELPSCLIFEIRKLYPNDKNDPYKGFEAAEGCWC